MSDTRVDWNEYFMNIAEQVATRSTCSRKHVGAVIVRDRTILSTGYNGSLRGAPHCDEAGHDIENDHCVRTVHAEANAVAQAAKHGVRIDQSEIYVTASPCLTCFKLVANAGITTVYYKESPSTDVRREYDWCIWGRKKRRNYCCGTIESFVPSSGQNES